MRLARHAETMARSKAFAIWVGVALISACSPPAGEVAPAQKISSSAGEGGAKPGGGQRDDGGGSGGEGEGSEGGGAAGAQSSIFTPQSDFIEIGWFNFWSGGYRWVKRRDQLSTEQLALAKAITVVSSTEACTEDAVETRVSVTDGDARHDYYANDYAGTCGRDETLVEFSAVTALLDTAHCLSSQGYDGDSWEKAPTLVPDDGCWHGLFNFSGEARGWWFRIEIPAAGDYTIAFDDCGDRDLQVELLDAGRTTALGTAPAGHDCPVLTQSFEVSGTYALHVESGSGAQAGDFYMSVASTAYDLVRFQP